MNEDFEEFFALLHRHGVDFLVIGGVAYNYHAPPRATKDIDVWVGPSQANLERLLRALAELGLDVVEVDVDALIQNARVLMIGRVPNRIDVLTRPDGLVWEEAWLRRIMVDYGTSPIGILSIADLILGKRAAGRPRDLADVAMLEKIVARQHRTR